jgi:hypothetical protein
MLGKACMTLVSRLSEGARAVERTVLVRAATPSDARQAMADKYARDPYARLLAVSIVPATLADFYTHLERLDWTFMYSDDHRVFREGSRAVGEAALMAADAGEDYVTLYEAFRSHHYMGAAKPPCPEEDA